LLQLEWSALLWTVGSHPVQLKLCRSKAMCTRIDWSKGGLRMGERAKGRDKGKMKKKPKAVKPGVRPHEQPRQVSDLIKKDS